MMPGRLFSAFLADTGPKATTVHDKREKMPVVCEPIMSSTPQQSEGSWALPRLINEERTELEQS
jgi:hypothetical protein